MLQTELNRRRIMSAGVSILNYLKFTALEDNSSVTLTIPSNISAGDYNYVDYSLNKGKTWIRTNNTNSAVIVSIPLNKNEFVLFRGKGLQMATGYQNASQFSMTGKIAASGNIMSLLYEDNFETAKVIDRDSCFYGLFKNCISLIFPPELPATTLYSGCYGAMFNGCTSLIESPLLPALTLPSSCYGGMFYGCTSLRKITMLATEGITSGLFNWVVGVSATGTFIKNPATTLPTGDSGIPAGWTVEDYRL